MKSTDSSNCTGDGRKVEKLGFYQTELIGLDLRIDKNRKELVHDYFKDERKSTGTTT